MREVFCDSAFKDYRFIMLPHVYEVGRPMQWLGCQERERVG